MASAVLNRRTLARAAALVWVSTATAALAAYLIAPLHQTVGAWFAAPLTARSNPTPTPLAAVATALHNARVFCPPFLIAAVRMRPRHRLRFALDLALGVDLTFQTCLVGSAVGAEGERILPFLPHLPIEWLSLTIAVAVWLAARRGPVARDELVRSAGIAAATLVAAGVLEVYATPHL